MRQKTWTVGLTWNEHYVIALLYLILYFAFQFPICIVDEYENTRSTATDEATKKRMQITDSDKSAIEFLLEICGRLYNGERNYLHCITLSEQLGPSFIGK